MKLLTESINVDYPVQPFMVAIQKERSLYFKMFVVGDDGYIVKFANESALNIKLGLNAYRMSIHKLNLKTGIVREEFANVKFPSKVVSGVAAAIKQFHKELNPAGLMVQLPASQDKLIKVSGKILTRIPQIRKWFKISPVIEGKEYKSIFLWNKGKELKNAYKFLRKSVDDEHGKGAFENKVLGNMTSDGSIDIGPTLDKIGSASSKKNKLRKVSLKDVFGGGAPTPEVAEFEKKHPPQIKKAPNKEIVKGIEKFAPFSQEIWKDPEKSKWIQKEFMKKSDFSRANAENMDKLTVVERDSVNQFTIGTYSMIRNYLASGTLLTDVKPSTVQNHIRLLDSSFKKSGHNLPAKTRVFRGLRLDKAVNDEIIRGFFNPNKMLRSYTSFTFSPSTALSFSSIHPKGDVNAFLSGKTKKFKKLNLKQAEELGVQVPPYDLKILYVVDGLENSSVIIPHELSGFESECEVVANRQQLLKVSDEVWMYDEKGEEVFFIMSLSFQDKSGIIMEDEVRNKSFNDIIEKANMMTEKKDTKPKAPEKGEKQKENPQGRDKYAGPF